MNWLIDSDAYIMLSKMRKYYDRFAVNIQYQHQSSNNILYGNRRNWTMFNKHENCVRLWNGRMYSLRGKEPSVLRIFYAVYGTVQISSAVCCVWAEYMAILIRNHDNLYTCTLRSTFIYFHSKFGIVFWLSIYWLIIWGLEAGNSNAGWKLS